MKISGVMSGAAVLALVAGLAWAGDETEDFEDGEPGHSEPWPGDDGDDGGYPTHGDDDLTSPGGGRPDDDDLSVMPIWHDDGSCAECDFADGEAREVAVTSAPVSNERREARRDWREVHQANRRNVCFEADLYVPALCDWQRPFLGDRMP